MGVPTYLSKYFSHIYGSYDTAVYPARAKGMEETTDQPRALAEFSPNLYSIPHIIFYYPNGVKTSETRKQKPLEMNNSGKHYSTHAYIQAHMLSLLLLYIFIYIYIHTRLSYNFISPILPSRQPFSRFGYLVRHYARRKIILPKLYNLCFVLV